MIAHPVRVKTVANALMGLVFSHATVLLDGQGTAVTKVTNI